MIAAKVDLDHVQRGLDEMVRRGMRPGLVLGSLRKPARKDQMEHGKAKQGPDGPWPARAASTTQGRGKRRARIRRRRLLGRLSSAINIYVRRSALVVQSKVRWSNVHQQGGTAGRGARIPERRFLWWSGELLDHVAKRLLDHVGEGW